MAAHWCSLYSPFRSFLFFSPYTANERPLVGDHQAYDAFTALERERRKRGHQGQDLLERLHQTIQHGELLATMIGFDYKEAAQSRGRAKLPFVSLSLLISLISSSPAEAGACEWRRGEREREIVWIDASCFCAPGARGNDPVETTV